MTATRVLMVTRGLPFHNIGGMEAIAWDLARAFVAEGAEVTILTTACPALGADTRLEGLRILCVDAPSGRYSAAWWRGSVAAWQQLAGETDIVLSVSAGARAIVRRRALGHARFFMQAHGTAWGEFRSKIRQHNPLAWARAGRNLVAMWEDRAYRHFDGFIAVGALVETDLSRNPTRWLTGNLPVHVIENGVAPDRFRFDPAIRQVLRSGLALPAHARVVLSASRLHPQKGILEGIDGFLIAADQNPDLHYVIAGSGPDEGRLRARAAASRHAARVHFVGNIPRDALGGWLSAADLFLFTTRRVEGLPLNILEARAAGLPVVAAAQVCDPRFNAVPVNPDDAPMIARAIVAALAEAVSSVGALRMPRLVDEFTLATSARRYLALFRQAMQNGPLS